MASTIKCILKSTIKLPPDKKGKFLDVVEKAVVNTSQIVRRASLFLLLHVTRLSENKLEMPNVSKWTDTNWRHLLLAGLPGSEKEDEKMKKNDPQLFDSLQMFSHLLPHEKINRIQGDGQIMTAACQQLRTSFYNSQWMPVIQRIKKLCKLHVKNDVYDSMIKIQWNISKAKKIPKRPISIKLSFQTSWYYLFSAVVSGNKYLIGDDKLFVEKIRNLLNLKRNDKECKLCDKYLKKPSNRTMILKFNVWLQKEMIKKEGKIFKLSPVFKVKRHNISLDIASLTNLLNSIEIDPPKDAKKKKSIIDWLKTIFELPGQNKLKDIWNGFLKTDGYSACFVFGKEDVDDYEQENTTYEESESMTTNEEVSNHSVENFLKTNQKIIVGIDPGRVSVVHMSTNLPDGKKISSNLSRTKYRHCSGITRHEKRVAAWNHTLQKYWTDLSILDSKLKTSRVSNIVKYIESYNEIQNEWWESMMLRKRSKADFRVFAGKKRTVDTYFESFFRNIRKNYPEHELKAAYGAGTFSSSGKGQLSTLTTTAYKACCRHVNTEKQNECRTSKQCCNCHGDIESCWKQMKIDIACSSTDNEDVKMNIKFEQKHGLIVPKKGFYQRGLLFCPKCSKFLNRDRSGAMNIRYLHVVTKLMDLEFPKPFKARYKKKLQ
jgi:hypothetical protein